MTELAVRAARVTLAVALVLGSCSTTSNHDATDAAVDTGRAGGPSMIANDAGRMSAATGTTDGAVAATDASRTDADASSADHDGSTTTLGDAAAADSGSASPRPLEGTVHIVKRMGDASFDKVVTNPSPTAITWLNDHLYRMEVFTTFFDDKTSFYPNGLVYWDSAAIYVGSSTATAHPNWILQDAQGKSVYVDWNCQNGTCPQYAADISNADFRAWWIAGLQAALIKGYKGVWIDDVNLALRFSDGTKSIVAHSPTSHTTMTEDAWSQQVASFMGDVRAALSGYELLHNSIWYARPTRTADASVKAEILAADVINMEGGFASDQGLTGGTGSFSVEAKMQFVDAVHALGRWVIVDDFPADDTAREYALACYLMLSNGRDGLGNASVSPTAWWKGYDVQLGAALGARMRSNDGVFRREFEHGVVLILEPGAANVTIALPKTYVTIAGVEVTSVTLSARHGAVLVAK